MRQLSKKWIAGFCAVFLLLNGIGCASQTIMPPMTEPPATEPLTTELPTTELPVTEVPTTEVPATEPPATEPPATNPPIEDKPAVPQSKRIAFTFDDGPSSRLTYQFVDKLKEYGASATFFVVGNRVAGKAGEAIRYASENGCEVGIHGYTHEYYFTTCGEAKYQEEVSKTDAAIRAFVDAEVRLMRPPGGNITKAQIAASPYSIILWSVDSEDWKYKKHSNEQEQNANIQTIVNNVLNNVREGDIVLMHEIYENSYQAFCIIIDELYRQGYEIVSVSELLGDRLTPGVSYRNGR